MGAGMEDGHQIVAMFDSYAEARRARDALVSAGVPGSALDLLDRNAEAGDTNFTYERTDEGFWGAIKRLFVPEEDAPSYVEGVRRGHALLVVRPEASQRERVIALLEQQNPVDLDTREAEWKSGGWTGAGAGAGMGAGTGAGLGTGMGAGMGTTMGTGMGAGGTAAGAGMAGAGRQEAYGERQTEYAARSGNAGTEFGRGGDVGRGEVGRGSEQVIPVVEEELRVGKRAVGSGSARIRSYVIERPVQEQVNLREEHVHVERRPVSGAAGTVPADAFRERSIEVTATSEEAVVAKEARVVEEVVLRKDVGERTETVSDTVRRTEVEVEEDGRKLAGSSVTGGTGTTGTGTGTTGTTGTTTPRTPKI